MPDDLEEIKVKGRRRSPDPKSRPPGFGQPGYKPPAAPSPQTGPQTGGNRTKGMLRARVMEEIKVRGKLASIGYSSPAEFHLGRERYAAFKKAFQPPPMSAWPRNIDEIKVVNKRLPRLMARSPVLSIITTLTDIIDAISVRRLDEAGRIATQSVRKKRDTKVETIKPEAPIPEIVVRGVRPQPKTPTIPRIEPVFPGLRTPKSPGMTQPRPPGRPEIKVERPQKPKLKPDMPGTDVTNLVAGSTTPGTLSMFLGQMQTQLRSRQLQIPRDLRPPSQRPRPLTDLQPQVLTSPKLDNRNCPPCKKRKEQDRAKCYKTLVKQARNPSRDKVHNLVEINCDTGREIYKRKLKGK